MIRKLNFFFASGDRNTPICGAAKIACYNEAEDKLLEKDFTEGLANMRRGCNCLPGFSLLQAKFI